MLIGVWLAYSLILPGIKPWSIPGEKHATIAFTMAYDQTRFSDTQGHLKETSNLIVSLTLHTDCFRPDSQLCPMAGTGRCPKLKKQGFSWTSSKS
jgi:hypothetical protein